MPIIIIIITWFNNGIIIIITWSNNGIILSGVARGWRGPLRPSTHTKMPHGRWLPSVAPRLQPLPLPQVRGPTAPYHPPTPTQGPCQLPRLAPHRAQPAAG